MAALMPLRGSEMSLTKPALLEMSVVRQRLESALADFPYDGKKLLILIPDQTRTMPLPEFFRWIVAALRPRVKQLDFMIALGTHPALSEAEIDQLFHFSLGERRRDFADIGILNHAWNDPTALLSLGTIPASEIAALSNGMLEIEVPVRINRAILDYDELLVCGPVFPHEVVGFSGGNKYFFPGIAGADIIDITHWIGALVTSYKLIGTKHTPVRAVIDRAAGLLPRPARAICSVVEKGGVYGLFAGSVTEAWNAAADLAALTHITWVERSYRQVLAILPAMYSEMWVGAKGMYKLEPVVTDGGELIIYAPHIKELSVVHGELIRQVGYHCRDYFVKQWDQFKHLPWGTLAHSTHLKGMGSYDPASGIETPRISVTLATGLSQAECQAVNLGWRDPESINPDAWRARAKQTTDLLVVDRAGEQLYRLRD